MLKLRVLNFQYNLLKMKPKKLLSMKDQQISDLIPKFQPNRQEMKQVFDKIDSDKDGKVSFDELCAFLSALGKENVVCEAKSMLKVADLNKDGFIDFEEFMEVHKKGIRTSEIQSAFWMFDQDKEGRISAEELRVMLQKLGESCSLKECQIMVRQVSQNGDGLVSMDDFMAMMTSTMKLV